MMRAPGWLSRCMVLAALLLGLLAPTVSQALAWARGDALAWSQVCRASLVSPRAKASILAARQAKERDSAHGVFEHCPCHAWATQDLAPPPSSAHALALAPALGEAMPERFLSAPHADFAWRTPPGQAPPSMN